MTIEQIKPTITPKGLAELAITHGALQKPNELEKLAEFVIGRPHKTVLEIGTCKGGTLWFWHHLPNNNTVVSVDMPNGEFGGGPTSDDRDKILNWVSDKQNTILVTGDSHKEETLTEVKEALAGELADILFIDGDHTYEGVKKDFEMYSPLVKNGGLIVLHDIVDHSESNPACQVEKFWQELTTTIYPMGIFWAIIDPARCWAGIGVMQW